MFAWFWFWFWFFPVTSVLFSPQTSEIEKEPFRNLKKGKISILQLKLIDTRIKRSSGRGDSLNERVGDARNCGELHA